MLTDKYKCDPRILRTFDLIGTFFVDVFYNKIYGRAKEAVIRGEVHTTTEAFMTYSMQYIKTLRVDKNTYKATVNRLYEFYKGIQGRPALSFVGFEGEIASTFFPREQVKLMQPNDMDVIIWEIVTQTIVDFASYLLSADMLAKVIDDHSNRDNVNKLQEKYVLLFMAKRDSYHEKIVQSLAGKVDTSVSGSAYNLLQTKLIKEASEHLKTRRELQCCKKQIVNLQSRLESTENALCELANKLRELALSESQPHVAQPPHTAQTSPVWPAIASLPDQPASQAPQETEQQDDQDLLADLVSAHCAPQDDYYEVVKPDDEW